MNGADKTVLEAELAAAIKALGELRLAAMKVANGTDERRAFNGPLYAAEKVVEAAQAKLTPKAKRGTRTAQVDANTGRMIITTVR